MISQLRGLFLESNFEKDCLKVLVDVQGVGYEVLMCKSSQGVFRDGQNVTVYVCESVTAYDGATTLYGFPTKEEKDFFNQIRDNVGGMGPKKALDCLDKINKSLPDFKRAIIDNDSRILVSVFGFSKKKSQKDIKNVR